MKKVIRLFAFLLLTIEMLNAQWAQITNIPIPPDYIADMEIDGSRLYAVSDNGIFKSSNNGGSWAEIFAAESHLFPTQVEAAGNTVCFAALDNNTGIFVYYYSTDGGATFQPGGPDFLYVDALFVQSNKVFVLDDSGFYISEDQGATFTNTGLVPLNFYSADIEQTPAGKILLFTSLDPNTFLPDATYVYRSTDDVNWIPVNTASGNNPLPMGEAYFSTIGYLNGALFVGGYNPNGTGALYKSTDMGANWYPVNNSLFGQQGSIAAFGTGRIYLAGDSGNYTSTDGANWAASNLPNNIFPYDGAGNKFAAGGYQGTWISSNSGNLWTATNGQPGGGNDYVRDYLAIRHNTRFAVTTHNGIFRGIGTDPANMTWTKVLGATVGNGGNYGWDIFKKGSILLAGIDNAAGGQKGIFRSANEGNSWTKTHNGTGLCFFDDGSAIYAGVDFEGIFKSYNSGQTWSAANNGIPTAPNLRSPSAFTKAGNNLIASFYYGGIYLSSNQGASWSQVSTETLVYCLAKAGSTLFAGTQNGLMKSTDNGLTWSYVQNDLYNNTTVTAIYVKSANEIYIGTGSMGLFVSNDGGETVEPQNDGAGDNNFVSCIARESNKLFAGWNYNPGWFDTYYYNPASLGRSLWQYDDSNRPSAERQAPAEASASLVIYPNPVQEILRFSLKGDAEQVIRLQIINTFGQIVREEQGPLHRPELEIQDLNAGTYILKITLQDGSSLAQPFIATRRR